MLASLSASFSAAERMVTCGHKHTLYPLKRKEIAVYDRRLLEPLYTLIALGLLVAGCVMILLPFSSALVWAAIFVFYPPCVLVH
ncbi:MAG: hypothetical protein IPK30_09115 [Cellvibrionales bacterium]|nr:hypothetical protein [Cellvibrionales bacterium]